MLLDLLHHLLQALLEVAAIAGAGEQRAHVEREHRRLGEDVGHFVLDDLAREAFGDGGLADAGIAHEQRVVLLPAAENLDRALHFGLAADQRIDAPVARLLVQVDAIGLERAFLLLAVGAFLAIALVVAVLVLLGAARRARRVGRARALGDAVADVVHRVVARHVLLLQEVRGVAFALGEDGDEHVGAGHFLAAGRLHVDHGALDDALETGGGLGLVVARVGREIGELVVDVVEQALLQRLEIDRARAHHGGGVAVVEQREQQMLQRGVFMPAFVCGSERPVQRLFQIP